MDAYNSSVKNLLAANSIVSTDIRKTPAEIIIYITFTLEMYRLRLGRIAIHRNQT